MRQIFKTALIFLIIGFTLSILLGITHVAVGETTNPIPVPYIHQVYDIPDDFVGSSACASTSAVMILAYYERLPKDPIWVSHPSPGHYSDYGKYISQEYSYGGYTFSNQHTEDTEGCGVATGRGAWGYIWKDSSSSCVSCGVLTNLIEYLRLHDLTVSDNHYDEFSARNLVQQEIDNGRPLIGHTGLTSAGHYIVIVGYEIDAYGNFWYKVNDPFGEYPYGSACWGNYGVQQPVSYSYSQMGLAGSKHGLITVTPPQTHVPDNYPTIQAAVDAASPGYMIIVRNGTYTENVKINKDHLTIKSEEGAEKTIVQAANSNDHVFEVTANSATITGFTAKGAIGDYKGGIWLNNVENSHVSHNICRDNWCGIRLYYSSNNTLEYNTCSENGTHGISVWYSSNNILKNNACSKNVHHGIHLNSSSGNTLENNNCSKNNHDGIWLYSYCSGNTLKNNTCSRNNRNGIYLDLGSSGNIIYLNNLIDNKTNFDSYVFNNTWNSPEEITYLYNGNTYTNYLGNHWSDYTGSDGDGDGIGNTAYIIRGDKDNYPLMKPFENYGIAVPPTVVVPELTKAPNVFDFPKTSDLFTSNTLNFITDYRNAFSTPAYLEKDPLEYYWDKLVEWKPSETWKNIFRNTEGALKNVGTGLELTGIIIEKDPIQKGVEFAVWAGEELIFKYVCPDLSNNYEARRFVSAVTEASKTITPSGVVSALLDVNALIYGNMLAQQFGILANDPPDPNFTQVFQAYFTPGGPFTLDGISPELNEFLGQELDSLYKTNSYLLGLTTTINRYGAALEAGDPLSAGLQFEAFLKYLSLYDASVIETASYLNKLRQAMLESGIPDGFYDRQSIITMQDQLRMNGLPIEVREFFENLGLSPEHIDELVNRMLEYVPPDSITGSLYSTLSDTAAALLGASSAVDVTKPTSHVLPLPSTQSSASFLVQWSGTDMDSGIKDFTIFVSDNGGPFSPFISNTISTSSIFAGQRGHTYAFYSLARDVVGNTEDMKTIPDATTKVALLVLSPAEGTIGTEISITGSWFGAKKGKVLIGSTPLTIIDWTDGLIHCRLKKALDPEIYDVTIQPKEPKGAAPIIEKNDFTVKAAEIDSIEQGEGTGYGQVTIYGKFFGTKKGKVYLEYEEGAEIVTKSCKVTKWWMDPVTNESEIIFTVPKMLPEVCDVVVDPYGAITDAEDEEEDAFTVKAPDVVSITPNSGSVSNQITISGNFFGSKKPKVYLGYVSSKGKPTKKSCSIVSWGDNGIVFKVPNLPVGSYDVIVINSVSSDTLVSGFSIE